MAAIEDFPFPADRTNNLWHPGELAIVDGPPSTSAATHTAMKAPDVPMMSTCPAPIRPNRAVPGPNGGDSADQQRREDGPRQVLSGCSAIRATMTSGQDHRRHNNHGGLQFLASWLELVERNRLLGQRFGRLQ